MQTWIFFFKRVRFFIEALLDRLFDGFSLRRCFGCKRACADPVNGFFCLDCYPKLKLDFAETRKDINFNETELKFLFGESDFYYPKVYYSQKYTNLNKFFLREFKYRRPYYGDFAGKYLADYLTQNINYIFADTTPETLARTVLQECQAKPIKLWLAAVPMRRDKFLRRSFNQAEIIAREFFAEFSKNFVGNDFMILYQSGSGLTWHDIDGLEFIPDLLTRVKNTGSLYDKSRQERIELMSESLEIRLCLDLDANYENILLLFDDVVTTGATFVSCYRAILQSEISFDDVVFVALMGN